MAILLPIMLGLERVKFENKEVTFEEHIKHEHSLWHYLFFIVYIKTKESTEFTGPESYVSDMINTSPPDLEWFPRLRCMSLNTEEAENTEQNEMKELRDQLNDTNQVVKQLSSQLSELRDRMMEHRKNQQRSYVQRIQQLGNLHNRTQSTPQTAPGTSNSPFVAQRPE
ncbi:Inositol 1,4,5-trisphosphate receptor type 2 [Geodia barretti]|uniref:Inositol 1,4,5-trisphosphate receptor type 2 n=1 Tax=Geodia barretti TaxID=519541 RepID=A0AA35WN24_GEOBA|nr:Inositol 1,4,5-trisphosphate receptor type 2 [Geodia barretti]